MLMEQLDYNLLFRWDVTVFTKNRERLLDGCLGNCAAHISGAKTFPACARSAALLGMGEKSKSQEGESSGIPPLRLRSGQAFAQRTRKDGAPDGLARFYFSGNRIAMSYNSRVSAEGGFQ
jgi:hypothetical protein